jgi:hypothetical protein
MIFSAFALCLLTVSWRVLNIPYWVGSDGRMPQAFLTQYNAGMEIPVMVIKMSSLKYNQQLQVGEIKK